MGSESSSKHHANKLSPQVVLENMFKLPIYCTRSADTVESNISIHEESPLTIQLVIWPIVDPEILMRSACCYIENTIDCNWKESRKMTAYLWLLLMSFLELFLCSDMGVTQYFPDSSHSGTEPIFGLKHTCFASWKEDVFAGADDSVVSLSEI